MKYYYLKIFLFLIVCLFLTIFSLFYEQSYKYKVLKYALDMDEVSLKQDDKRYFLLEPDISGKTSTGWKIKYLNGKTVVVYISGNIPENNLSTVIDRKKDSFIIQT